jgi:hypothetical protein
MQQLDKKKSISNDLLDKTVTQSKIPKQQKQQMQKKNVCFNDKVEIKDYELNESLASEHNNRQNAVEPRVRVNENQQENENVIRIKQRGRMGHTIRPH